MRRRLGTCSGNSALIGDYAKYEAIGCARALIWLSWLYGKGYCFKAEKQP
jgi:hypothetical protein